MTRVLVSDLGQVVLPLDWTESKRFLRERCRKAASGADGDPWAALGAVHDRTGFGTGSCEPDAFFRAVVDELDLNATYDEFCKAWSDVFTEDWPVVELLRKANVQHRFLLSNTNIIHWNWILEHHSECLQIFDRLLPSQELGAEKPNEEIYRKVEALTGLPPSAHLMIDDLAANVEGARACGWDGIVHTDAANLERELRRRNLLT